MKNDSNPLETNHAICPCGKILTGRQTKFCSRLCKNTDTNTKHQVYEHQQKRGLERKIELIKLHGGECSICGYKKNSSGLSFHHLDPSTKKFSLDIRHCSNRSWPALLEEAKKCQLVCLICHAEIHHPRFCLG